MRALRNLVFLLLICIVASGFPLYTDSLNIDVFQLSPVLYRSSILLETEINELSPSHFQVDILFTTRHNQVPVEFDPENPMQLELLFNDQIIQSLNFSEIVSSIPELDILISKDEPFQFRVDLPQEILNVPDGNYQLKIQPNLLNFESQIEPLFIPLSYQATASYVPSLKSIASNQSALTLYFSDRENKYLFPITRVIPYTSYPIRFTVLNLEAGPAESLGLSLEPPVPAGSGTGLSGDTAIIRIRQSIEEFTRNDATAKTAIESYIHSLTSINEVSAVQFYFNGRSVNREINGRQMNIPQEPSKDPKLFAAYVSNTDRILLFPIPLDEKNASIPDIFEKLKFNGNLQQYDYTLQPTVPAEVELLDYKIEGDLLKLKFNNAFMEVHQNSKDRQYLMVQSLLYTFTSFENIQAVQFEIEDRTWGTIAEVELFKPAYAPLYINPEK